MRVSETVSGYRKQLVASEQDKPADRQPERRHDPDKLLVMMNGALVGVPSAYALSNSLEVTAIAAALAVVLVSVYLARRGS